MHLAKMAKKGCIRLIYKGTFISDQSLNGDFKAKKNKSAMKVQNKSLEVQSALKRGKIEAKFDFIMPEMDLQSEIGLRFELEKGCWTKN